ncbi:hypothetical protein RND81_02G179800 [Saponaria officinalis]|uniref:MORF/ORRM1/DAG-like MORF domain-containing protein n=1 Tax=Saponaria officinalis TaxID=3572 RepID=A0AAW1MRQ3_SAPOF
MATLRLRRALSLSSVILSYSRLHPTTTTSLLQTLPNSSPITSATISAASHRHFHSSRLVSFSAASRSFNDIEKIDPDTILFEGCDYKHWLIVMDFGKDPDQRPPPDQMVETYVQTCAQIVGSVEEAKKKIYACSTTTYTGFQVEVDEETSKKFEGLPGVIFVLPDSYIDPVNKEYGGDKYINGEIIPRSPPVQYGRTNRGYRSNDRRPRDSVPYQQGNPGYNQHGSMPQGGRGYTPSGQQQGFPQQQNFPPQQNYPPQQQNYGPSGQADRGTLPSGTNYPGVGVGGYQGGQRNFVPPQQGNYNHGYNRPQGQMSNLPGNHGGSAPPGQYRGDSGDHGYSHPQGQRGNIPGDHGGYAPSGQMGGSGHNQTNFPSPGAYGQTRGGSFQQSEAGQGPNGRSFGHGAAEYAPHGENQRFPQTSYEQSNPMGHGNYSPGTQTTFNQVRPSENSYGRGAGYTSHGENQRFPPTSNDQSNSVEHGNYPPGTQTGFNRQGRY